MYIHLHNMLHVTLVSETVAMALFLAVARLLDIPVYLMYVMYGSPKYRILYIYIYI